MQKGLNAKVLITFERQQQKGQLQQAPGWPASSFVGLRKIKILIKTLSQHCFKKTIVLRSDLHAIPRSRHPAHGGATQAGKILELPSLFSGFPEASKVPVITSHAAAYCSRRQPTRTAGHQSNCPGTLPCVQKTCSAEPTIICC